MGTAKKKLKRGLLDKGVEAVTADASELKTVPVEAGQGLAQEMGIT